MDGCSSCQYYKYTLKNPEGTIKMDNPRTKNTRKHLATATIYHFNNAIDRTGALHCQNMRHAFVRSVIWDNYVFIRWWFYPGTPISSTYKTDLHDITEFFFKVALNSITITLQWVINYHLCETVAHYQLPVVFYTHGGDSVYTRNQFSPPQIHCKAVCSESIYYFFFLLWYY
jgi:hypothetical protein